MPLAPISALLEDYDHVLYSTRGQSCAAGIFSPNFIGTRAGGTALWQMAWERLHSELKGSCRRQKPSRHQVACCYDAHNEPIQCITPWGLTDRIVRPIAEELAANLSFSVYCFEGQTSLAPFAGYRPGHLSPLEESCVRRPVQCAPPRSTTTLDHHASSH